jgi:hypothetical protein
VTYPAMLMITSSPAPDSAVLPHQQTFIHRHVAAAARRCRLMWRTALRMQGSGMWQLARYFASGRAASHRRIESPQRGRTRPMPARPTGAAGCRPEFANLTTEIYACVGQPRFGLGHEMKLTQGIRVVLDVIHQLGNLLFSEQVEREVARQVSESESNARICQ